MSNQAVGPVYQSIIEEVINSSRVDFEENGVEESVLEELRLGWQQKLSQLDVARFPWDPPPPQPAQQAPSFTGGQPSPAANAPSGTPHSEAHFSPQLPIPTSTPNEQPHQNGIKSEPQAFDEPEIKQEPGAAAGNGMGGVPNYAGGSVASARAQQQLHAIYGQRAAGSINALQGASQSQQRPAQQQQPQPPLPQQVAQKPPPPAHPTPALSQEQLYRQQMAAATAQQSSHLKNGQTDGAGEVDEVEEEEEEEDLEAVLMRRSQAGELEELGRVEIDSLLHRQIAARAKAMEGGGLMVPLQEATAHKALDTQRSSRKAARARRSAIAAHDGGDDEEDEDAINSDLDDSDDENGEDEVDDEGLGSIMLCMYDKVQRVKNKWKCTLKDGVLTVNGKEYVFHKATGEYEW